VLCLCACDGLMGSPEVAAAFLKEPATILFFCLSLIKWFPYEALFESKWKNEIEGLKSLAI
jgi:hypothetical protein